MEANPPAAAWHHEAPQEIDDTPIAVLLLFVKPTDCVTADEFPVSEWNVRVSVPGVSWGGDVCTCKFTANTWLLPLHGAVVHVTVTVA
jgi:hypothetical protein